MRICDRNNHGHIRLRLLTIESPFKCVGRIIFAEARTIKYRHSVVVYERDTVDASFLRVSEKHIYPRRFEPGDKIRLIGGLGKRIGDDCSCRVDINPVFRPHKPVVMAVRLANLPSREALNGLATTLPLSSVGNIPTRDTHGR